MIERTWQDIVGPEMVKKLADVAAGNGETSQFYEKGKATGALEERLIILEMIKALHNDPCCPTFSTTALQQLFRQIKART